MLGHINNVAMAALFDAARVRFNTRFTDMWKNEESRVLIAALNINYLAESYYPEAMLLHCGIGGIGRSSWQIAQAAFQYQGAHNNKPFDEKPVCVAAGSATLVMSGKEGSIALPTQLRDALQHNSVVQTHTD